MPHITIAQTAMQKFSLYLMIYKGSHDNNSTILEILNAFFEKDDPAITLADVRLILGALRDLERNPPRHYKELHNRLLNYEEEREGAGQ